ncbi:dipeptidase PepV [Anoxybacter fermentans]|uniref:Dipeptidase PepV n=1 Tax=Anoxybacter fermentans TaxID=1323375 RepID=A0A3S9SUX8_9FIRM|nr:dipeptidase PepV [Anoxybacter fermentans]AZR72117.1 dipeptidase PepV [Anoxybacter fermentans]
MDLLARVDNMRDQIIKSTQELVRIRSVEEEAQPGMPFGKGVNDALEYVLKLSEEMGFKTKNLDGYAGHAEIGEGDEIVGILVHLDVVPEGSNWTYPPYGGEIHDNKIYGRGTIDDKGPAIAALYAMKAVLDSGIPLKKRVRIIFGTDEESGWEGIKYYLKHEEAPTIAFAPDAEYPAIHGEKGILIFNLEKEFKNNCTACDDGIRIVSIKGGNAPNMVPDYCEAVLAGNDLSKVREAMETYAKENEVHLEWEEKDGQAVIKSHGVSAHGSLPESGQNAISQLMVFLASLDLSSCDLCDFIKFYAKKIGMEYYGQSIGCGIEDDVSGKLIFNVGLIDLTEEKAKVVVNIRYPVTSSAEEVYSGIEKELEGTGIKLVKGEHMKPLYVPADDELVVKLMDVYRELTGDDRAPITIGGGTYARAVTKAVAFGPLFPGQPELAHQKDEFIGVDDLILNTKIYAKAIVALAG